MSSRVRSIFIFTRHISFKLHVIRRIVMLNYDVKHMVIEWHGVCYVPPSLQVDIKLYEREICGSKGELRAVWLADIAIVKWVVSTKRKCFEAKTLFGIGLVYAGQFEGS